MALLAEVLAGEPGGVIRWHRLEALMRTPDLGEEMNETSLGDRRLDRRLLSIVEALRQVLHAHARGKAISGEAHPHMRLVLVEVIELDPPGGAEPVCWRLLTTLPVETAEDACRIVDIYHRRWMIGCIEVYRSSERRLWAGGLPCDGGRARATGSSITTTMWRGAQSSDRVVMSCPAPDASVIGAERMQHRAMSGH